jgi:hypothetical protein
MRGWRFAKKIPDTYWFWYFVGVFFAMIGSLFQQGPGYMDVAYYTVGGLQIFEGKGFFEPYLWNYLSNPKGLPSPAFTYWMPMPSLLVFMGMLLGNSSEFFWAKLPFILLTGLLPVLSVYTGRHLLKNSVYAWIAGGLAVIPGIYIIYVSLPETFVPYMIGGGLFIIVAFLANDKWLGSLDSPQRFFLLGLIAGWMHLTRADGLIWLFAALGIVIFRMYPWNSLGKLRIALLGILTSIIGYLILTGGWYYRNWLIFGGLFPPGNSKSLWLTHYNELYSFPNDHLNFTYLLKSGWDAILQARLKALGINLQNFLAVQGSIVLVPLILAGIWSRKKLAIVKFGILMWLVILGIMTMVFPFAGSRGGFLHSGAATQIFFWVMAVVGLEQWILWMKKIRGWNSTFAISLFGAFLILVNAGISIWFFQQRVFGNENDLIWNQSIERYQRVAERLKDLNITNNKLGMVNNPPGYYWATRMPSIVIPDGDINHSLAAARKFGVSYLLLEQDQENLIELYQNPKNLSNLRYLETFNNVHIFLILSGSD